MSLPPAFTNAEDYFEECISFLLSYRELYWKSNTDVLNGDLSFHIAVSEENNEQSAQGAASLNKFSKQFFKELERLAPSYENFIDDVTENLKFGMSLKKAHEVIHLTEEIKSVCQSADCQTVVDLGAGMGYVDLEIFEKTGISVLGLEGKESFYVNAKTYQRKHHPESLSRVKYIRHIVSEDSDEKIAAFLKDKFSVNKAFCFMGLHACGDLTVSAMNLFLKMKDSRALVVTPCCYHKMAMEKDNICRFKNFPLSKTLRKIYEKFNGHEFLNVPILRVAAQPSYIKNEDMKDRVFYLLSRALLEVYAKKYSCYVQKKRRKAVRTPPNDFTKYAEEAARKGFKLVSNNKENTTVEFNLTELQSMWKDIPATTFKDAAIFINLQNKMPPIFENLILYDRLVYLKEQGIKCCYYKKVVNEKISPKCLSLFAIKENLT